MRLNPIKLLLLFLFIANLATAQHQFSPEKISKAALELTKQHVVYDGSYFGMPCPNGDVPKGIGVCTDVIIRTYNKKSMKICLKILICTQKIGGYLGQTLV